MDRGRSNEGVWYFRSKPFELRVNNTIGTLKTNVSISLKTTHKNKKIKTMNIDI